MANNYYFYPYVRSRPAAVHRKQSETNTENFIKKPKKTIIK